MGRFLRPHTREKSWVRIEWRFLESNRWLYKDRHSGQDRPTSSLIEGTLSYPQSTRGPTMVQAIGRTALMQLQSLLQGFLQDGAFPFSSVLTVQDIVDLISQTGVETCDRVFTPMVT